jgi:hypothetical protein
MKWFQHDSDARSDFKLKRLEMKYGLEGSGLYWAIIELLAHETTNGTSRLSLETYPIEDIAKDVRLEVIKLKEMLNFMADVGLIDKEDYVSNVLCCKALTKRADDYSQRVRRHNTRLYEHSTNNVRLQYNTVQLQDNTIQDITSMWNGTKLPSIREWSTQRKLKLVERMKSKHFADNWKEAITKLGASSFATGGGDTGWKATIDWFLHNDTNYIKCLEGKYDGKERDRFSDYK